LTKNVSIFKDAFNYSLSGLEDVEVIILDFIVKSILKDCVNHLQSANDIPRLYRRTNRDIPKQSSTYIANTISIIVDFNKKFCITDKDQVMSKCTHNIIDSICIEYQSIANDLLESVKKMEDSLARLRRVRQDTRQQSAPSTGSTLVMSDDDKIRLQLYLDIVEFGNQLNNHFNYKGETNYEALYKLVNTNLLAISLVQSDDKASTDKELDSTVEQSFPPITEQNID
jgi:conserved oligomeric Golgi complex subunit 2